MNETEKPTGSETYEGPLSPAGVAALKFAVVGMAVLIVVGLLVVIGRIIYLASTPKTEKAASRPALTASAKVSIPRNAQPVRTSVDGSRLSILYRTQDEKFGVMIIDLQTGTAVSHVQIEANGTDQGKKLK